MNMINAPEKVLQFFTGPGDAGSKLIKMSQCCCQTTRHYILEVINFGISHFLWDMQLYQNSGL
jgi:hypothetical protein